MNKHIWCEISVLALIAFLATTSNGLCRKLEKLTELHISGYKAHIIHTNACIEVRKSIIEPNMLDLEVPGGERFRRTFTTDCCCEVTSKTLELVGRPLKKQFWSYLFILLVTWFVVGKKMNNINKKLGFEISILCKADFLMKITIVKNGRYHSALLTEFWSLPG